MSIIGVDVIAMSAALNGQNVKLRAVAGNRRSPQRHAVLVRVRDDAGLTGESYSVLWGAEQAEIVGHVQSLRDVVIGTPAHHTELLWSRMFSLTRTAYWQRPGLMRALSIIDCAAWDLCGKRLGRSLDKIWGVQHSSLPLVVMDSAWSPDEPDDVFAARVVRFKAEGYAGCKVKVGASSTLGPVADARRLVTAREAVGPDFLLYADGNQGWSVPDARRFAACCEAADLAWLEEPCFWNDDKKALAALRSGIPVPIAAGQMEITSEGCRDLMTDGSIDVCNFDANIGGGATAWRRVAHMAQCFGVSVINHMDPQIGGHLAASVGNGVHVETYDRSADPFYFEMIQNRPRPVEGRITLNDEPGWGWTLDEAFIARHRVN